MRGVGLTLAYDIYILDLGWAASSARARCCGGAASIGVILRMRYIYIYSGGAADSVRALGIGVILRMISS